MRQDYYRVASRVARAKAQGFLRVLAPDEIKELWRLIDKLDRGRRPPE